MSTIKISQLPPIPNGLNANTSNSLFVGVDIPTGVTGNFTATQLAERLYANNQLVVGQNPITFSNTAAQFSGSDPSFLQTNQQNFNANGSGDYIVTGDQGTNSNNYIDLGLNGSNFQTNYTVGSAFLPNDGYLYVQGPGPNYQGNLLIGTGSTGTHIMFAPGGLNTTNVIGYMDQNGAHFPNIDANSSSNKAFTQAAFNLANTNSTNITYLQGGLNTANANSVMNSANISILYGIETTQNTNIQSAWNLANTALQNTNSITVANNLTVPGVLVAPTITTGSNTTTINNGVYTTANVQGNYLIANSAVFTNVLEYTGLQIVSPNYLYITPSNSNVQLSNTNSLNILLPNTSNTITITMPQNPINGQVCGIVNGSSNSFYYQSNTSNPTIVPVFTGVQTSPGTKYRYVYNSTNNTWYAMP